MNNPASPHVERRRIARQKSFLRGMISFHDHRSALDCLVRDISPYGARLVFADTVAAVPDTIDLNIPQKSQTLRAHVIWRHGQEIGVAFAQASQSDHATADSGDPALGPAPSLAERVARLELEIAALKRVLKKMKTEAGPEFDV